MPNDLPLPPELQHLLEKRSGEERRQSDGEADLEVNGDSAVAPAEDGADVERRERIRRREDR